MPLLIIILLYFINLFVVVPCSSSEEKHNPLVEQFIARKADILFSPAWKTAALQGEDHEEEEAVGVCLFDCILFLGLHPYYPIKLHQALFL